jgi:hypothetical protein
VRPSLPKSPAIKAGVSFKDRENLGRWEAASRPISRIESKDSDVKEILEKYPKIANLALTQGELELKDGTKTMGTLRSWIRDYIEEKGLDYHTREEREAYLLAGKNPAKLDKLEKDKLRKVLESFDDGKTLKIDSQKEKVIF